MMNSIAPPMFDPAKEQQAFADALAGFDLDEDLGELTALAGVAEASDDNLGSIFPKKAQFTRTLSQGMSGDDVKTVQKKLKALGYGVPTSGSFGASTASAVVGFQQAQDLSATGQVDQSTWNLLMKKGGGSQGLNTFLDAFAFTQGAASHLPSILGKEEEPQVYAEVVEEEPTDWLLIGGLAVGGVVLVGGLAWLVTR